MTTYAITGANRGIGLALTRALLARGDSVLAICRHTSPELDATGTRVIEGVDIGKEAEVEALAKALGGTSIDVLVNNAGLLEPDLLSTFEMSAIERQMQVNAFGPVRVTRALLPRIASGGKIVVVTSRMGSIADNGSGGYYGYRMSKAALNSAFVSFARDLSARKIAVGIFHPGMVATEMTGGHGITPAESAAGLIQRMDELSLATSGKFFHQNGEALPW